MCKSPNDENQLKIADAKGTRASDLNERIVQLQQKVDKLDVVSEDEMFESIGESTDDETDVKDKASQQSSRKSRMERNLKEIITRERCKRSQVKSIVNTLKQQKSQQKLIIDQLLEKNHELDLEMKKNNKLLRKKTLKNDLNEEHLKTVKCLKGSLLSDLDSQNSMILDKTAEVNRLTIERDELEIRYKNLQNRFDKERKILKPKKVTEDGETQTELEEQDEKIEEDVRMREKLEMEFRSKESELKNQFETDFKSQEEKFQRTEEILKSEFSKQLEERDVVQRRLEENIERDSEIIRGLESKVRELDISNSQLLQSHSEGEERLRELEVAMVDKDEELEKVKEDSSETLQSLKLQFSHMADTYENKIERMEKDNEEIVENLQREINQNLDIVKEKDELIDHLKRDLAAIKTDLQGRMRSNEERSLAETRKYEEKIENLLTLLETKEKEIENVNNESKTEREKFNEEKEKGNTELRDLKQQVEKMKVDLQQKSSCESDLLKSLVDLEESNSALRSQNEQKEKELVRQRSDLLDRDRDNLRLTEELAGLRRTIETMKTESQRLER